ncbi:MAG TPA: IPT/TIG domain-containing protein [Bryobacteraceae bacterium]|nr:IPT/TIG domain-containing protein [Bryobacteraceae bacterium]
MNDHSTTASRVRRGSRIVTILTCLAAAALLFAQTTGYTITTIAGNGAAATAGQGASGFAGDGGPANQSQLSSPFALAVDSSGNLYIDDTGNQRIRKVSGGNINTIAGNGTGGFAGDGGAATSAEIYDPQGIAVDSSGNLYIADTNNNVIRKVASGGSISTIAGSNLTGAGYVDNPVATNGQFSLPVGIAVDSSGNIYISESSNTNGSVAGNNRIRKVSSSGALTTYGGNGVVGSSGDNGPATTAHLSNPLGLAVDKAGNLYIADTGNHKIRRIAAGTGIITTVAGTGFAGFSGDGGPAINAQLNSPTGVAVDAAGNLYIADKLNFRIRMVSTSGIITTIAGKAASGYSGDGGPATSATLRFPTGVAVDSSGNVYVADNQNNAIRLLTPPAPTGGSGPPAINSGGIVSASAFGAFTSIAPGSWIEIYGTNLAADTNSWDGSGTTAPTTIDRTSVVVGGQAAFVNYISPGQVNVQVPSTVPTGTQPIVVSTAAGNSNPYNITVNATQPGLLAPANFMIGGKQYVVAQFGDGTFVLPPNAVAGVTSRQAKPGETIVIYGVGFGPVNPSISAGQVVQFNNSLTLPIQFSIGGTPTATPLYYGLAPTLVGLYQFNVVVPTIPDNDTAPLTFTLGGSAGTQTLFTAVKN